MVSQVEWVSQTEWKPHLTTATQQEWARWFESGKVIAFPALPFLLQKDEGSLLQGSFSTLRAKNISWNPRSLQLKGIHCDAEAQTLLQQLCARYHQQAMGLLTALFPFYQAHLQIGMTSFRPIEIAGRKPLSPKKDDTRLHIDAFPSRPNQGRRIVRVFTNIHPAGKPRVWRIGEPFAVVAKRFISQLHHPVWGSAALHYYLGLTKGWRTPYDSYMLQLHDRMKADASYQSSVTYEEVQFMPGTTWIVMSDCVSHAVLSGQHMMEQTAYLPVSAMLHPELSPLRVLESLSHRRLTT